MALVFSLANSVGPITMISGGILNAKLGSKKIIIFGGIMFSAGMILTGLAKSVNVLYLTYGLLVGLGVGFVYGNTVSNSVKFFPDKRGFAGGVATASYGLSSVIIPIIANKLMSFMDVTKCFLILGTAMFILIIGASFFVFTCPADYVIDGYVRPEVSNSSTKSNDKNWKEMLKDPIFYIMIAMLLCGAFGGMMITSQASPIAQRMIGMTASQAALAVSVLALFNTGGRIVAGSISDKIGVPNTILGVFAISIIGQLLLFMSGMGTVTIFFIGVCIAGLCFGSIMGVYAGFTAEQFGAKNNGINYGIMFIGFAVAGYFGPAIASNLYASSGTYKYAFVVAMGLSVVGIILDLLYKKATRK